MPLILHIETATAVCSVALSDNGRLIHEKTLAEPREHARMLTVIIDDLLSEAGYIYKQLAAVSVSKGPGSYTGLRIGVATAKGLCYALDIPLIGIGSLYAMADCAARQWKKSGNSIHEKLVFCPMIDARRMEVYSAVYDSHLSEIDAAKALILEPGSFDKFSDRELVFFGDGSDKYSRVMNGNFKTHFMDSFVLSADGQVGKSNALYGNKCFDDVAYFEPFYLKDFVSGPKSG
jgi:tRNA threonylcarbamoyladenosine biosynthesis protein TsaB